MSEGKKQLAAYGQTNQRLARCMHDKGLPFDGGLAKADVADAFNVAFAKKEPSAQVRAEISALTQAAPVDTNSALLAKMSTSEQAFWSEASNDCSAQIDRETSGTPEQNAKIAELQAAAASSPEVKAAVRTYVDCMRSQGFTVSSEPFSAPQAVMDAEEESSATAVALVDGYHDAWRTCVQPYQQTYDRKLFGSN
jgi:hypothetical protein